MLHDDVHRRADRQRSIFIGRYSHVSLNVRRGDVELDCCRSGEAGFVSHEMSPSAAEYSLVRSCDKKSITRTNRAVTIDDYLSRRRLSVFGHIARLDVVVPANRALRLAIDMKEGRY